MNITLAQAAESAQGIPVSYVLTALAVLSSAVLAGVGFLWKNFLKQQREADHQRKQDAERFTRLETKVETMSTALATSSNFVAAMIGMSMNGDTILSSKVHDMYNHFKPSDGTGAHRPLKS